MFLHNISLRGIMKKDLEWGKVRYYSSYSDDFFHNPKVRNKKIKDNYRYIQRGLFLNFLRNVFYYIFAVPIIWMINKARYGVKVYGRKNLKKIKGGYIIIGNHSCVFDQCFASVMVAWPRRNYIVANKGVVEVPIARYLTRTLGALPLPDGPKGLINLSNAITKIVTKKKDVVTIYPEAHLWPYYTGLRPLPPASFHYAVKSDVPVVPVAVTYRYAKGKNYLKKRPRVNLTILEPIYANKELSPIECKADMAKRTEDALRKVIETEDNVALFKYVYKDKKSDNNKK